MSLRLKSRSANTVAEARLRFVYVILAMMLIAGTTDWFGAVFTN